MTELFSTWGAKVVGGRDAQSLLDALGRAARYPDLVVADLRLGDGASGVITVRALRDELGFAVPALIVSGDTSAAAERAARSAGLTLLAEAGRGDRTRGGGDGAGRACGAARAA